MLQSERSLPRPERQESKREASTKPRDQTRRLWTVSESPGPISAGHGASSFAVSCLVSPFFTATGLGADHRGCRSWSLDCRKEPLGSRDAAQAPDLGSALGRRHLHLFVDFMQPFGIADSIWRLHTVPKNKINASCSRQCRQERAEKANTQQKWRLLCSPPPPQPTLPAASPAFEPLVPSNMKLTRTLNTAQL